MAFLCLDHRNGRRWHPAQFQCFPQIFFSQVVDGYKVLVLVHLHRSTQLEPDVFLYRCGIFLAIGPILCYTFFRAFPQAAPVIFGFQVGIVGGSIFLPVNIHNIVKDFPSVRFDCRYNVCIVKIGSYLNFNFPSVERFDSFMFVLWSFPIHFIGCLNNFIQVGSHAHFVSKNAFLFRPQILCFLRPKEFFLSSLLIQNFPSVTLKPIRETFPECLFDSCSPFFFRYAFQNIFINFYIAFSICTTLDRESDIPSFRRTFILESCGVFFCCPQGVHGLFGVGEVFVLQGPSLGLGQPLCLQGAGIAGVDGQHFLGPADDVAQQILHTVHHLVDGTPHARIFLGLSALEFHPALEVRFRRKDSPPRICHQLFGGLFVGKLLAGVHVHLVPDHLVYAFVAVHLGKVGQGMVLQALCARLVEGVIPVVVLVQHGAEDVAGAVPEEDAGRLRVHISPDVRVVLQHVLQHSVGAGGGGVQLDDPAAHVGAVVIQRPFIVDPPLSARALVGQAAAVAARLFLGVCTVEVGGIQRDPPALAAVQNIIDVQGSIVHHTGQPQRVVEALHLVHLRQMVDR